MRSPLVVFACVLSLAQPSSLGGWRVVKLVLPHALRAGETAVLELTVGPMERGMEIEIATTTGQLLGIVSPYGVRAANAAGTYAVPVPVSAISKNRISLRLSLIRGGHPPRAPSAKEVRHLRVRIIPASEEPAAPPRAQ